jgi:methoxymalonate biosynthesis acyl carrier protein
MATVELTEELVTVLSKELQIRIESTTCDLFANGTLDSLGLVDLWFLMEQRWGVRVEIDQMELDNFRTVERIAEFINTERVA